MASSKHVLLIGGSGRTGRLVIKELLGRDHKVYALVRKPEAMQAEIEAGLEIITGTPMKLEDVRNAFKESKPEVVIVTLSAPRASDSPLQLSLRLHDSWLMPLQTLSLSWRSTRHPR